MDSQSSDFLVIGSGLAGLTFALRAAERGKVVVLTKAEIQESNTNWAQGGIAAAVSESDSWELHEEDTLVAGAGLCNPEAVRYLVQQAPKAIEWLISLGARFDTVRTDMGGHAQPPQGCVDPVPFNTCLYRRVCNRKLLIGEFIRLEIIT